MTGERQGFVMPLSTRAHTCTHAGVEAHRQGDEEWGLAFPIGEGGDKRKPLQLNSGYKSSIVLMHGKLWLQTDLGVHAHAHILMYTYACLCMHIIHC